MRPARRDVRARARRGPRRRASARTSPTTTPTRSAHLLTHEHVVLGLSDAGAHVDQLCDAPLPTDLLGTWVRERERHAARARGAQAHRRAGRHVRLRAAAATCARATGPTCACSIPRPSAPGPTRRVRDFPADAERLTAEEPTGVRHVLVNGTPIRVDGAQLDVLRPARACGPSSPEPSGRAAARGDGRPSGCADRHRSQPAHRRGRREAGRGPSRPPLGEPVAAPRRARCGPRGGRARRRGRSGCRTRT